MAHSVSAQYEFTCEVAETVASGLDNVADRAITHSLGADAGTLGASSTPAATQTFSDTIALTAGAAALDLQSLAGPSSTTINFTGLKVQLIKIKTPATNADSIIVEHKDGATGYNLFGDDNASDESIEVPPDSVMQFKYNDKLEDVDGTHKDVKFTGTGTDGMQLQLTAG